MNEKELDELLHINNEFDLQVEKRIKKEMRKQIYSRVIIILLIVAIGWQIVYHGTSFFMNITQYNPLQENKLVLTEGNRDSKDIDVLMQTFVEMYFPGDVYYSGNCLAQGFGKYELTARIQNTMKPFNNSEQTNVTFYIHRSHLSIDMNDDSLFDSITHEYYDENANEEYKESFGEISQSTIKDIQELPDSTILDVALSFPHTISVKDTLDFMNQYKQSKFIWLANHVEDDIALGMSLCNGEEYILNKGTKNEYQNFYLPNQEDYTIEVLTENYLSKLKLLIENKEFMQLINTRFTFKTRIEDIKQQYQNIKNNGLQCIGLRAYVKKKDLLNMIENQKVKYIYIHDIKLSSLQ